MIASLDMYDFPEIRDATDAWWDALARGFAAEGLEGVPPHRTRGSEESAPWSAPDLFFSQICGYPLRKRFRETLQVVGTPCYRAEGCTGPRYRSVIIVQRDAGIGTVPDLQGARLAYNGALSQSGMSAYRALLAENGVTPGFSGLLRRSGHSRHRLRDLGPAAETCTAGMRCGRYSGLDPGCAGAALHRAGDDR